MDAQDQLLVPVIQLPHRLDENSLLIFDSSPSPCQNCHWEGDASKFMENVGLCFNRGRDLQMVLAGILLPRLKCASCHVLNLALIQVAMRVIQARLPAKTDHLLLIIDADRHGYITSILQTGTDEVVSQIHSCWHLFSPLDGPRSPIDIYNIPRRSWTGTNISCENSAQFAKNCIEECRQSHEICRSGADGLFLPTRMICVDAYQLEPNCYDVRLDENTLIPPGSRYVALSYCWGDYRPACMTTSSNLPSQMERIRWEALPATFQDAVNFTRSLDVRYLWIDSVCIMQQECGKFDREAEADWIKEAAKMFEVYKNSYATLAALYGHDSRAGLRMDSNRSRSTALASLKLGKSYLPLFIRPAHFLDGSIATQHHGTRQCEPGSYPLLTRAWTFQERMVSPRVLYFTDTEIVFQCSHDAKCECGVTTEADFQHVRKLSTARHKNETRRTQLGEHRLANSAVGKAWREEIVTTYSGLDLTEPRDRLPALGAVAQQFQAVRHNEKYLAGLWSATIHQDLLWTCSEIKGPSHPRSALRRPYSLPTWSWASLPVSVNYDIRGHGSFSSGVAVVVQANCVYGGESQFGNLQNSNLILRSRALRVLVKWKMDNSSGPEPIGQLFYSQKGAWIEISFNSHHGNGERATKKIHIDHDGIGYPILPEQEELYVFEIARGAFGSRGYLLLRKEDQEKSIYTRAGIISDFLGPTHLSEAWPETPSRLGVVFSEHSVVKQFEIR